MVDAVPRSWLALEHREPSLKIRGIRLQNPILDVMTFCAAHGEEAVTLQLEDLTAHQVQNMGTNAMHLAAVPIVHRISFQRVIVFMIPTYEQCGKGPGCQPIQPLLLRIAAIPDAAEVSIIPNSGQWRLYRKKYYPEIFYIALKMQ